MKMKDEEILIETKSGDFIVKYRNPFYLEIHNGIWITPTTEYHKKESVGGTTTTHSFDVREQQRIFLPWHRIKMMSTDIPKKDNS